MKIKTTLKTSLFGVLVSAVAAFATSDYSTWSHSKNIVINPAALGLTAPVTNFPVLIRLNEAAGTFTFSESQSTWSTGPTAPPTLLVGSGGGDIRFTDTTGTDAARNDLSYQIEYWNGTTKTAQIWVLVPSISNTSATTIKMYWGKTGLTTPPASHSGPAVFSRANVSNTGCEASASNASGFPNSCGFVSVHHMVTNINGTNSVTEPNATGTSITSFNLQDKTVGSIEPLISDTNIIGNTVSLDGVDQAFGYNSSKNDSSTNATRGTLTLSAWVYSLGVNVGSRIISKTAQFHLGSDSTGTKWEYEYDNNPFAASPSGTPQKVSVPMAPGWNYVVGTRTPSGMTIYVNGTASSSTIATGTPIPTLAAIQTTSLGYESGDAGFTAKGNWFHGSIDEPRIENVTRNSDWVRLNYETQKSFVTAVTYGSAPVTVATPVAVPTGKIFSGTQSVSLSTTTTGASIYYTTNGDAPAVGGSTTSLYTGAILLSATSNLRAIAVTPYLVSGTASQTYTLINPLAVTQNPASITTTLGSQAIFTFAVSGTSPTFKWLHVHGGITDTIAGATNDTLKINSVAASDTGSYVGIGTNTLGTVLTNTASLTLTSGPAITSQPVSVIVTLGGTASFIIGASGTGSLVVKWVHIHGATTDTIAGATTDTLKITTVAVADTGSYKAIVSNGSGSTASLPATLTVLILPTISTPPANQTATVGAAAKFFVVAAGTAPFTYKWVHIHGATTDTIAGAITDTLKIATVAISDTGSYKAIVTNTAGLISSATATLTVLILPTISTAPVNQSATIGTAAKFFVVAAGTAPFTYKWIHIHGTTTDTITGATSDTLKLATVALTDTGTYKAVVRNSAGVVTSTGATLTVTPVGIFAGNVATAFKVQTSGSLVLFRLPGTSATRISLIDVWGREVWNGSASAGVRELSWNGSASQGRAALGIYIVRFLTADSEHRYTVASESKIMLVH